jgi:hypothetical protein
MAAMPARRWIVAAILVLTAGALTGCGGDPRAGAPTTVTSS